MEIQTNKTFGKLIARSVLFLVLAVRIHAQDTITPQEAAPPEILQRTFMIDVGGRFGTVFSIDYKDKIYLITARHVAAALAPNSNTVRLWHSGQWQNYSIKKSCSPNQKTLMSRQSKRQRWLTKSPSTFSYFQILPMALQ
jgi:hypothetical protein